ncbi:MAG: cobalamin-dependent protein [Anaerolineales bacterium]
MTDSSKKASRGIREHIGALARNAVDRQYALQPDLWESYGQAGYEKSVRDGRYHFSYLAEALAADDASLFLDYVGWAKVLFAGLDFPPQALMGALECMDQALQETLEPKLAEVARRYIHTAQEHLPHMPDTHESHIRPGAPLYELASQYMEALLRGERSTASALILKAVDQGISVKEIYLHVFQPCQWEVGRLWQMNQVSVAQEHFCTAATQLIMSQLYPQIFATEKTGHRLVATSVSGELHEIGMRMVADFMEMKGWDTYYVGANTPTGSVLRSVEEREADVLAISATISFHVSNVRALIERIRSSSSHPEVRIMVGGHPFNISPGLWQEVRSDGYAPNAQEAVTVATRLVEETHGA